MAHKQASLLAFTALLLILTLRPAAHAQTIVGTVDLPSAGRGLVIDGTAHRAYVAVNGAIQVYDVHGGPVLAQVTLPQNYSACLGLALDPTARRLYAVGSRIYALSLEPLAVLQYWQVEGAKVAVNPATHRVYVAGSGSYADDWIFKLHVLDGTTGTWLPSLDVGSGSLADQLHLAIDGDANQVYLTFTGDDTLRLIDGGTLVETARRSVTDVGGMALDTTSDRITVRTGTEGALVLACGSLAQVGTVAGIGGHLGINPAAQRLYGVGDRSPGNLLQIYDLASGTRLEHVYLEGDIYNLAVDEALGMLWLTNASSPSAWAKKATLVQDASPTAPAPQPVPYVMAVLSLPENGDGVAIDATRGRLYVGVEGAVLIYDVASLALQGSIDLSTALYKPSIAAVGVDETANRVCAVSGDTTWVLDAASRAVLAKWSGGNEIAVNSANGRVYIGDDAFYRGDPDRLRIYDGRGLAHIRTLALGTSSYYEDVYVAVNPTTGYAYCTYSYGDSLRIISPATDDVETLIDFDTIGQVAVDPATNRVFVWGTRSGHTGVTVFDGITHAEVGLLPGPGGRLRVNSLNGRLYSTTGMTLFQARQIDSGELVSRLFLDGSIGDYAIHPALSRLYVTHFSYPGSPEEWAKKLSVIQDSGAQPTPSPTPSPTATPRPTATPFPTPLGGWPYHLHLPLALRQ
jgi:DNA-binding beta-propeller fold protein YncE